MDTSAGASHGGADGLSRRRTISNLSKLFAPQRGSGGRAARHARLPSEDDVGGGFLLPHEIRRNVHSEPGPVNFAPCDDLRASVGSTVLGNHSLPEGARRTWRRGRRIPKVRVAFERPESAASALSAHTTYSSSSVESWPALSDVTAAPVEADPMNAGEEMPPEEGRDNRFEDSFDAEEAAPENHAHVPAPPSLEILALRHELAVQVREMRELQEKYYAALNASLQENFLATGALESRLDALASSSRAAEVSPRGSKGSPSTELMWTVVDGVSMLLLWLISVLVARPYQLLKKVFRKKDESKAFDRVSRKSWRLSASKELCMDNDGFFFNTPRRLSFRDEKK